jgi:hypothetical protein
MTNPPAHTDRASSRMESGTKALIGCGIGCATILGLLLIVIGLGGWWLFSKEDQVPTNRILDAGSSAALRLEDISKNHNVMQLINDVSREAERINRGQIHGLPEPLEKYENYFEGRKNPGKLIEFITPKEATLSVSSDEEGNKVFAVAVNFKNGTRIPKLFFNSIFETNEELRDKKISTESGDLFLIDQGDDWNSGKYKQNIIGFYEGTFIFSNDREYALSALEKLAEGSNEGELRETLSDPFYRLSRKDGLAYGVLDGSLLKSLNNDMVPFQKELCSDMKIAEISLDELSGKNGLINLKTEWSSKESAVKANKVIEELKPVWINKAEQKGFDMEVINSLKDEQLDIQFHVKNIKDSLINHLKDMDDER